jgi:tripartite-type tricarboxylate transporter receptor subunit TctC
MTFMLETAWAYRPEDTSAYPKEEKTMLKILTGISTITCALALSVAGAQAQEEWRPTDPITMIVGFAAGGPVDLVGREVAQRMSEYLGQPVIVENLGGAGGEIAMQRVVQSEPNGETIFFAAAGNVVIHPLAMGDMSVAERLEPVSLVALSPHMLSINAELPFQTVEELLDHARANPGALNAASAGTGAAAHLGLEMLKLYAEVDITHVPYQGTAPSIVDLASGAVDMTFSSRPSLDAMIDAGRIRIIGTTDQGPGSNDVPLIGDVVPGFGYSTWYGVMVPDGTDAAIIKGLNAAVRAALKDQELVERFAQQQNTELAASTPEEMATYIAEDTARWSKVIEAAGISLR